MGTIIETDEGGNEYEVPTYVWYNARKAWRVIFDVLSAVLPDGADAETIKLCLHVLTVADEISEGDRAYGPAIWDYLSRDNSAEEMLDPGRWDLQKPAGPGEGE
jgi:hypothetical protein